MKATMKQSFLSHCYERHKVTSINVEKLCYTNLARQQLCYAPQIDQSGEFLEVGYNSHHFSAVNQYTNEIFL